MVKNKSNFKQPMRQKHGNQKRGRNAQKVDAKLTRKNKIAAMKRNSKDPGLPNLAFYKKKMIEQLEHKEKQDEETIKMAKLLRRKYWMETGQEVEIDVDITKFNWILTLFIKLVSKLLKAESQFIKLKLLLYITDGNKI